MVKLLISQGVVFCITAALFFLSVQLQEKVKEDFITKSYEVGWVFNSKNV